MSLANYPAGFEAGINIRGIPIVNVHGGKVFWVSSVEGQSGNPGTFNKPISSIYYTVYRDLVRANKGDIIICKPGHVETIIAAAGCPLDIAGVTIIFLGVGADQAYITFTTSTGADLDIDAASVTLINPKFVAGVDALTGPIDVNAADFKMVNAEYHDGTTINTIDAVITDENATRMQILGYRFVDGNGAGTQKQSHIQLNGCDNIVLEDVDIRGDFEVGNIENVTDEVLNARLERMYLENTKAGGDPALYLDANATGICKDVKLRVATGTAYANSYAKMAWDNKCEGFSGVSAPSGDPLGTAPAASGSLDSISSDIVIVQSDVKVILSDLTAQLSDIESDLTVIEADTTEILSDLETIGSDLVVTMSDVKSILSDLTAKLSDISSDLTVIEADTTEILSDLETIGSDLVVVMSDTKVILSDLTAKLSDISSDLTAIETDTTEALSDLETIGSDLVVLDGIVDNVYSDTTIILSDIKAFVTKYVSDITALMSDLVKIASDVA